MESTGMAMRSPSPIRVPMESSRRPFSTSLASTLNPRLARPTTVIDANGVGKSLLTIAAGYASAWAIGDYFSATCQYLVVRAGFGLPSVYTCNPKSPASGSDREGSDLALLYNPMAQFHRLVVEEHYKAYESICHAEPIGVTMPLLHWARPHSSTPKVCRTVVQC